MTFTFNVQMQGRFAISFTYSRRRAKVEQFGAGFNAVL
jgi:hypothetical protein